MKLKTLFKFFVVALLAMFPLVMSAQESNKSISIIELRPPLNSILCDFCIEKNPTLTLVLDKNVKLFLANQLKKDEVIYFPVEVLVNSQGELDKISRTDLVSPIDERLNDSNFDKLLSLLKNKKITDTKIFNSKNQYLKGVLILKLSADDIKILNQ